MKTYTVEFDDRVAAEIDEVAEEVARVSSSALIQLLIIKALAPWVKEEIEVYGNKEV